MVLDAQKMEILKERVLIIQTSFIGDCILTLPMIQRINQKNPEILIDVLTIPKCVEIFASSPYVKEVIVLDKRKEHKSFLKLYKFVQHLKETDYSKVYTLHRSFRSALITLFLGVVNTYGFNNSSIPFVFKNQIRYDYTSHEVKRNLMLVEEVPIDDWKILPKLRLSAEKMKKIESLFSVVDSSHKIIAIAPSSEWFTKRYPLKYYKEIVGYLLDKGYIIFLMGSNNDNEICENLKTEDSAKIYNLSGQFTISESIEILKRCKLLITNDSAPTHMGMAADIKVLTIFISTLPEFGFYPYNAGSDYLSLNFKCKPCGVHGYQVCPLGHFRCAEELKPEIVIEKIKNMITL
jgi:heptosyltransferase-2